MDGQVEQVCGGYRDIEDGVSPDSHSLKGGYLDLHVGKLRLGEERLTSGVSLSLEDAKRSLRGFEFRFHVLQE